MNGTENATAILILKNLFAEMCSSRRQLKPILSEIIRAIDNNLFVDADSDEVKNLLEKILDMQERLSAVEELKEAAASKKIAVVDDAIKELDRKHIIEEAKIVLLRFKDLVCQSEDENEIDAAKKLKKQAHKLFVKAEKMDATLFAQEASKFIDIAEKIDDPSKFSSNSFVEVQKNFPDNIFLAYTIMKRSLMFVIEEAEEEKPVKVAKVKEISESEEIPPEVEEINEKEQRINALKQLVEDMHLQITPMLIESEDIAIETKEVKKRMTVKSLNNKLREFVDGREMLFFPILRTFCKCRIFSRDSVFENVGEDRTRSLVPIIADKIFNWGIADKISLQGMDFYYLNDNGLEMLSRVLSMKDIKVPPKKSSIPLKNRVATDLRQFILFSTVWSLKIKKANKIDGDINRFWIRSVIKQPYSAPQVFYAISLMLVEENWSEVFDKFILSIKNDESNNFEIKGIFLISNLDPEQVKPWIDFFKTFELNNIYMFLIIDEHCFVMDEDGNQMSPAEWHQFISEKSDAEDEEYYDDDDEEDFDDVDEDMEDEDSDEENFELTRDDSNFNVESNFETDNEVEIESTSESEKVYKYEPEPKSTVKPAKPKLNESSKTSAKSKKSEIHANEVFNRPKKSVVEEFRSILEQAGISDDEKLEKGMLLTVLRFFVEGSEGRGMLFLHLLRYRTISKNEEWASFLCFEIGYILDDPIVMQNLRGFDTFDFWDHYYSIPNVEINELYDYLHIAAMIKSFFAPSEPMSFQLKNRWNQINDDRSNIALKTYPSIKKLISLFKNFTEQTHASFASCLHIDHSNAEVEFTNAFESVKTVRDRADAIIKMQIKHPRSKGLVKMLYEPDGVIRRLLNVDDNSISVDMILSICSKFSDEDLNHLDNQTPISYENMFSQAKIGDYLDDIWSGIKVESHKNEKFTGVERVRQMKILTQALTALLSYAVAKKHMDSIKTSGQHEPPIKKALELIKNIESELDKTKKQQFSFNLIGLAVFGIFIEKLALKIKGFESPLFYQDCLLGSNYLELTKDGIPVVDSYNISSFSFATRVLTFDMALNDLSHEESIHTAYETAVRNYDLGILQLLEVNFKEFLNRSDEELKKRRESVSKQVDRQIERIYHEFLDNLELDRNYDRITNQEEIDNYIAAATEAKEHFIETKNAGLFQRFIDSCNIDIAEASLPHKNALEQRINGLTEKLEADLESDDTLEEKYPIIPEIYRQLKVGNLTVAEDYMNRLEEEGSNFNNLTMIESHNDALEDFLNNYEPLFDSCIKYKRESLEKIYSRLKTGSAKNRTERDAVDFVTAWQGLNTDLKQKAETSVIEILKHLAFPGAVIDKSEKIPPNQWNFKVKFPEYRRSKAAYPHSFAVYGTDIAKKGLAVIYLASNRTADNVIETLAATVKPDCGIICLVDFALSLAERRKLAQSFKLRPDLKDILVIDRVMAIYLTKFEDSVRGVKLLKTALPFARVQPYTTGGVVAPEMFIGRSKELARIRDMSGPVFVYGGRQLGKSALLRQVRNIENDPENSNFAFFIELKGLDSERSLEKIVRELKDSGLINKNEPVDTWDDFLFVMKDLMSGKSEKFGVVAEGKTPNKLMLLLDESDEFLSSIENSSYRAIDILRELRETFDGTFKFVLAGLHKVIRFEKNLSFGNLNHISILPFTPTDALELLSKPLSALGFVIEDESLTSAIFSKTNYYPGLIQYYCKMIVDAAGDNYLQRNFDVTKNPPYKLDDEYLKNMLGKKDFQDEINKKFQITLKLDDDNFYEIIALVIAEAYYEKNRPVHVSIEKIKETCYIYDIDKIADMNDTELDNLLGEMVELNLLRKVDGQYEFNRYAFWHMMGSESEVDAHLTEYGSLQNK